MANQRKILDDAVDRLKENSGFAVEIQPVDTKVDGGIDYFITIGGIRFSAIVITAVSTGNKNLVYAKFASNATKAKAPLLIVSGYVPKAITKEYADAGINYMDKAGNCFISYENLRIIIEGKKMGKASHAYQSRAFQEAGIRIIFQLLKDPSALTLTYRELAELAEVSLGSVGSVMRELIDLDFVFEAQKRRILKNANALLDRWITAYHDVLRPRLVLKRMRFTKPEQLFEWDRIPVQDADNVVLWGGEPAASLLTNYLTPEKFALYTNGSWQEVMQALKLAPADDGDIEVLEIFWKEQDQYRQKYIVPPLLIYADLVASRLGRNIETATIIRENELSSLFQGV
jgi:hypothetical protein